MDIIEEKFLEIEDEGIVEDDQQYVQAFGDRGVLGFGGVLQSSKISGKSLKIGKTDDEILAINGQRALHILNTKCDLGLQIADTSNFIEKCQKLPDKKFKNAQCLILASYDPARMNKMMECGKNININVLDIIRYQRLLKKYNVV